jgi:hypothetical protein
MDQTEALFNAHYPEIQRLIDKRQSSWRLSTLPWEDASIIILEHIWRNFGSYDTARPLDRWVNTVITNTINNLLRDGLYKTARPCIAATCYGNSCAYNLGGTKCGWTKSGEQDSSCRFYAEWERKKKNKFAVANPLSIENHVDESHNMQCDFVDVENAKKVLDENIKRRLTKEEYRMYVLLFVKNLEPKVVGKKMGFKKKDENNKDEIPGYLQIRNARLKIEEVSKQILSEQGIIR